MVGNVHKSFLCNYVSQPLDIQHTALTCGPIIWDSISGMSLIHFLFTDLVKFSTLIVNGRKFCISFLSNNLSQPHFNRLTFILKIYEKQISHVSEGVVNTRTNLPKKVIIIFDFSGISWSYYRKNHSAINYWF
jgi:hypothetical protein